MREICDTQLRFEFYRSNSKMSKKREKISEILEKDMSLLEKIAEGVMGEYPDMEIEYHNHTKRA